MRPAYTPILSPETPLAGQTAPRGDYGAHSPRFTLKWPGGLKGDEDELGHQFDDGGFLD